MTTTNRLNLLLSEILQTESSSSNNPISHAYSNQPPSLLTFAEHDYSSSSSLTAVPLPSRRTPSSLKYHRRHQRIDQRNIENSHKTRPLLNSSTLDDLFHALTLECEQYLADSSTSSYQNETYGQLVVQPSTIPIHIDSNDDDYENLHTTKASLTNGLSTLKTSIEVMTPEKRQVISVNISSKKLPSPNVSSSQTYPLISTSVISPTNRCSSEDDLMDVSSSSINYKRRRRRTRKQQQQVISTTKQSSSSDDERTNPIEKSFNEKKMIISKRSCSTDHRQQRIRSFYDNHPISMTTSTTQKLPPRRTRRRDISLQQKYFPSSTRTNEQTSRRFNENLCSPLSVLLTSTRSTSDFVDPSQQRQSRLEYAHRQPVSLLDRMHRQFYQTSPMHHNNNNIPTHRIPSYPVY